MSARHARGVVGENHALQGHLPAAERDRSTVRGAVASQGAARDSEGSAIWHGDRAAVIATRLIVGEGAVDDSGRISALIQGGANTSVAEEGAVLDRGWAARVDGAALNASAAVPKESRVEHRERASTIIDGTTSVTCHVPREGAIANRKRALTKSDAAAKVSGRVV